MKNVYCVVLNGRLTGRLFRRARVLDDAHYLRLPMPISIERVCGGTVVKVLCYKS